ncbi:hypothetical protein FJTKL_06045 [Diaporthe vaccinii]|uniref:GPI anchored protein n=1 Tax=Diaporthe vaccinii TaxID=105482 RepID=A0ABR4EXM3_9PEZI
MYSHSFAVASALVAGAMAQSTSVTSMFLYGYEGENIVASVISAAPDATSYYVNCAPGTDGSDCGFGPGVTFVDGGSSVGLHVTDGDAFTMDAECRITSDSADCTQTVAGPEANSPGIMISAFSGISDTFLPVTITAGLEKITAAETATATGSSATSGTAEPSGSAASGPSKTGISASSSATGTGASGSAATSTASNSTESNGAVAGAGQNLVLAGLSGVVGLVMAL